MGWGEAELRARRRGELSMVKLAISRKIGYILKP
jgi:hypothetical protein